MMYSISLNPLFPTELLGAGKRDFKLPEFTTKEFLLGEGGQED